MCCSSIRPQKKSHKIGYHPKKSASVFPNNNRAELYQNNLFRVLLWNLFYGFSTDWLLDALSITWQWLKLQTWFFAVWCYFSRKSPFCLLLYVQCILHGLIIVLVCVPFFFAHSEKVSICMWWLPFVMEIVIAKVLLKQLLIQLLCNGLNIAENEV